MLKSTTELKKFDLVAHPNGQIYQVESVTWIGGDNYRIDVKAKYGSKSFVADVHTLCEVVMSYPSKVGA
jgi:hypothetical protein